MTQKTERSVRSEEEREITQISTEGKISCFLVLEVQIAATELCFSYRTVAFFSVMATVGLMISECSS